MSCVIDNLEKRLPGLKGSAVIGKIETYLQEQHPELYLKSLVSYKPKAVTVVNKTATVKEKAPISKIQSTYNALKGIFTKESDEKPVNTPEVKGKKENVEVSYKPNPDNYVYVTSLARKDAKGDDYTVEKYTDNKNGTVTLKFEEWSYPLTVNKTTGKNSKGTWQVDVDDYVHKPDIKVEKIVGEYDGYTLIFNDPIVYEKRLSSTGIPALDESGYTFSVRNYVDIGTWSLVEDSTEMSVGITRSNRKDLFEALKEEAAKDNSNFNKLKEAIEKALKNPSKSNFIKRSTNTVQGTPVTEYGDQIGDDKVTPDEAKLLETDGIEVTLDQVTSGGKPLAIPKAEDGIIDKVNKIASTNNSALSNTNQIVKDNNVVCNS